VRITLQKQDLLVVDDCLPTAAFAGICAAVDNGEYHSVHARRWDRAWRLWDGAPLRGRSVHYDPGGVLAPGAVNYPTCGVVDDFIDTVREITRKYPTVAGSEGVDWLAMFLSPWLYPIGSALSMHRDGGAYSGAFTYFAHRTWRLHWGGELLVLDDPPDDAGDPSVRSTTPQGLDRAAWLSEDYDDFSTGIATCVFPRPNRLVLLGPARPHTIRRVDPNAGAHVRASLAGFFVRR